MTGAFIIGLIMMVVALSPKFWELIHWAPKPPEDNESGDSIVPRRAIRLVLMLIGSMAVAFNFPGIPETLGYPGWFFFGIITLYVGLGKRWTDLWPFNTEDMREDRDTQAVIAWIRVLALVIGAAAVGIGMQAPDEPKAFVEPTAIEQVVEPAPEPTDTTS